jgi:hypothetical protein
LERKELLVFRSLQNESYAQATSLTTPGSTNLANLGLQVDLADLFAY